MKRTYKILRFLPIILVALAFGGCSDPNAIVDKNTDIENHNWSYVNLIKYDVKIDDEKSAYNLYFNLRVTGDYKYSNIFILMHENGPGIKNDVNRYEFKLASADGEWLGVGSGNLCTATRCHVQTELTNFPAKGTYRIRISNKTCVTTLCMR